MKHLLLIPLLLLLSCTDSSNRLDSDDFETAAERVAALERAIVVHSNFEDAEFELFNVNGFPGDSESLEVPGASSWDYKWAIKVAPADIEKWTNTGMIQIFPEDYPVEWVQQITRKRKGNWETTSEPEYYTRKGEDVSMLVYRPEGLIFHRDTNL